MYIVGIVIALALVLLQAMAIEATFYGIRKIIKWVKGKIKK